MPVIAIAPLTTYGIPKGATVSRTGKGNVRFVNEKGKESIIDAPFDSLLLKGVFVEMSDTAAASWKPQPKLRYKPIRA